MNPPHTATVHTSYLFRAAQTSPAPSPAASKGLSPSLPKRHHPVTFPFFIVLPPLPAAGIYQPLPMAICSIPKAPWTSE